MTNVGLVVIPLVLACVLITSAVAKWREQSATASAIRLLRLPSFLNAAWVRTALPIGEGLLALAMLAPLTPLVILAAVAALALFITYWVVIARALTFNPPPNCGCFGKIGNQTVSGGTLARNSILVLGSGLFAFWAFNGNTVWSALASFATSDWVWLAVAVATAALAVLIVRRSEPVEETMMRPSTVPNTPADHGEPDEYRRAPIPRIHLRAPDGSQRMLSELAETRAQLLVFTTCGCGSTVVAGERAPLWQNRVPQIEVKMVATNRLPDASQNAWYDHGGVAYHLFGMTGTPSAVLLGADRQIAGGPVTGLDEIEQFVNDIEAALSGAAVPDDADPAAAGVSA